ncbi:hypothetical protein SG34_020280 [Thalassomonas viridans]|uniref:Uncharacterized protein n=1 Tax=Thalassomonas viridans TaxID=137584 RepID=A0AAE9YYS7_9GAMM|nr:hypothetical protein [Thalassomonas viridans]WDE03701.1 hypothetical protein SG34_020280 [Thalassomonas viridans]
MFDLTNQDWLLLLGGVLVLIWAISVFCFGRITVKHIEREMAKEGKLPPVWDKGIGGRLSPYAMAIIAKKAARLSIVDDEAIRKHARRKDWYLAVFYFASFIAFLIVAGVYYYLYGPE